MDEMQLREKWQYYISSFIRVEPTEGIPRSQLQKVVLTRNLPSGDSESDGDAMPKPISYSENLTISICLKSSKMVWQPGTSEYFVYDQSPKTKEEKARREKLIKAHTTYRENKFKDKFVDHPSWAKDETPERFGEQKDAFRKWMDDGVALPAANQDVEMD